MWHLRAIHTLTLKTGFRLNVPIDLALQCNLQVSEKYITAVSTGH